MDFWSSFSGIYDRFQWFNRKALTASIRRVAELTPQWGTVLECAAGTGEFSLAAAKSAGAVVCTDISSAMLKQAEKKAARLGRGNISFAVRDLTSLPEADGTYDMVIAANVLHLLPHPEQAVRELWRVTAPGGKLVLPTYLQGEASAFSRFLLRFYERMGFQPCHRFTLGTYRAFLTGLGLDAEVSRIVGSLPIGFAVCVKPDPHFS